MIRSNSKLQTTNSSIIPYLSILLALTLIVRLTIFVRQRPGTEFTHIDSFAVLQIILVVLSCALFLVFPFQQVMWKRLARTSGMMLILYYILSGLSAIWSPLPTYSLFRAVEYLSQILIVFVITWYCTDFINAERKMLFLSFIAILLGASMTIKFYGITLDLKNWHTNHYSVSAAMVFCYCFSELLTHPGERSRWLWRYGLGGFGFLILGTSVASFIAAGVGVTVAIFLSKQGRALFVHLLIAVSLTSGIVFLAKAIPSAPDWIELGRQLKIVSPYQRESPALSLHGRVVLWEQYMQEIVQSPLYGHGFAVSSRLSNLYTTNTHNGYLAALLGTGAIGFTVMCCGWYRLSREIKYSLQSSPSGTIGCTSAFTAALINNMTLSFIGEQWRAPSFVFVSILSLYLLFVLKSEEKGTTSPQILKIRKASQRRTALSPLVPLTWTRRTSGMTGPRSFVTNRRRTAWLRGNWRH